MIPQSLWPALRWIVFLGGWLFAAATSRAHDPGFSGLDLQVRSNVVVALLTLAPADAASLYPIDADHNGAISALELESARPALEELAGGTLQFGAEGGPPHEGIPSVRLEESGDVGIELWYDRPDAASWRVDSVVLTLLPAGHRQLLVVRDDQSEPIVEKLLKAGAISAVFDVAGSRESGGWGEFFVMGLEHIVMGYDHLLFLLGLLVVGGGFKSAVKIITSFTVAHSLTLALATLDWVRVPGSVVEPLIAITIIYVGIENLFRRNLERRWILTFALGLIHGLGFASMLRERLNAGGGYDLASALVGFNLGVEAGQLAIAALVLPVIWQLHRRPEWRLPLIRISSALVIVAGGYWLVQRVFLS